MAVTIAVAGGRLAMISAATGAMALVVTGVVRDHGVEYLLAATILAGAFQIVLGLLGVPRLTTAVPAPLVTIAAVAGGLDVPTVGDEASCPTRCPSWACRPCRSGSRR